MWTSVTCVLALLVAAAAAEDKYHHAPTRSAARTTRANEEELTAAFWHQEAQAGIEQRLAATQYAESARNAIMFLGDGMSVPTLAAARIYQGQLEGETGEEQQLSFEKFPTLGLAKTYCVDYQIPDSACTATAYLCGVKNNYGATGVTAGVPFGDCYLANDPANHVQSIAAWAIQDGRDVGIVTTTRITHASPSGAYSHTASRYWENDAEVIADCGSYTQTDIAHQLIHDFPGNQFKVILGGGRREFRPTTYTDEEGDAGRRTDGRDLIAEWQANKAANNLSHAYVWHRQQLLDLPEDTDYVLGLFESGHLHYHLEGDEESEPTLSELTAAAIRILSKNPRGFFLFVEGGRIDHAHHDVFSQLALDETVEMAKAVTQAQELTDPLETLIVVTSDHAHVMAFNGYSYRGHDILGPSDSVDSDGVPFMTLSYTNGPGFRAHVNGQRVDVTQEANYRATPQWPYHVDAPLSSETHGGDDVAVFAVGPWHQLFTGLYEQSQVPHLMAYAACIGPGLHACSAAPAHAAAAALLVLMALLAALM